MPSAKDDFTLKASVLDFSRNSFADDYATHPVYIVIRTIGINKMTIKEVRQLQNFLSHTMLIHAKQFANGKRRERKRR